MAAFSDYLETAILNAVLRNISYSSPNPVYVGLFTSTTTDAGGGTEVTGGSYARQAISFAAPSGGTASNAGPSPLTFPQATASWGGITHFAIYDALSGGNMLFHAALQAPVTIDNGDIAQFPPGTLSVTLA